MMKTCYLSFYVDVGLNYWPDNIHESLLIGVYLPLLNVLTWKLRRSILVLEVERKLRLMQKEKNKASRHCFAPIYYIIVAAIRIPDGFVWQLLYQGNII